jgi:flagellar biosynthetic protein FliP
MTRRLLLHYLEMVVAMLLGMFVLGGALTVLLEAAGIDVGNWDRDLPALFLLSMAFVMTVPMVGWMRHRGHGRRPCAEMAGSMFLPTIVVVGMLAADVGGGVHSLMAIQHVAMFPAMLGVMLLRREEYGGSPVRR